MCVGVCVCVCVGGGGGGGEFLSQKIRIVYFFFAQNGQG